MADLGYRGRLIGGFVKTLVGPRVVDAVPGILVESGRISDAFDGRINGTVLEGDEVLAGVVVRCFHRNTGIHAGSTVTAMDGTFSIDRLESTEQYYCLAFDPAGGVNYNALIYDQLTPLSVEVVEDNTPVVPNANFAGLDALTGVAPLTVMFADTSLYNPTSWLWEKNDGSGWVPFAQSTLQFPMETFALGTWQVRLTATNAAGSDTETKAAYVVATLYAYSLLVINDSQADSTTVFDDQSSNNHAITVNGNAQYDTAQFPTGLSSSALFDAVGDRLVSPSHASLAFGTGAFTIGFWGRFRINSSNQIIFDMRNNAGSDTAPLIYLSGSLLRFYRNGADLRTTAAPAAGTWFYCEYNRSGTTGYFFVDGVLAGASFTDNADYPARAVHLGGDSALTSGWGFDGHMASAFAIKGYALHTSNFTPPSLPLVP